MPADYQMVGFDPKEDITDLGLEPIQDDDFDLELEPIYEGSGAGDLRVAEQRITDRERIKREGEERMQLPQSAQNEEPVYNELQNIGMGFSKGVMGLGSNLAQIGSAVTGTLGRIDSGQPIIQDTLKDISTRLAQRAQSGQEFNQELEAYSDVQPGSSFAPVTRALAEGAVSVLPAITPYGLAGGTVASGVQSGASTMTSAQRALQEQNDPSSWGKSLGIGVVGGLLTAAITRLGGSTGPEAMKELLKSGAWNQIARDAGKGALVEGAEEWWDQMGQSALE